jgi:hypothetical protein
MLHALNPSCYSFHHPSNWLSVQIRKLLILLKLIIFYILMKICMVTRSSGSPVNIGTGLQAVWLGFNSCQGQWWDFFLLTTTSELAMGPNQPPIQRIPGVPSTGLKRPWCEADHSPPSSVKIKSASSYISTPCMSSRHGASLSTGTTLP